MASDITQTYTTAKGPHKVLVHHAKKGKRLFVVAILLALLAIGLVGGGIFWLLQYGPGKQTAEDALRSAVGVNTVASETLTITSRLGFTISYNTSQIDADAKVITSGSNADVYTDNESLKAPNDFAIVDLLVKKEVINGAGIGFKAAPSLALLTNANRDFFESKRAKLPGKSDMDIVIEHYKPDFSTSGSTVNLESRGSETVGNVEYQKLTYKIANADYPNLDNLQVQYIAIQHSRPFVISLHYYPSTQQSDLAPLFQAMESIVYSEPSADAKYLTLLHEGPVIAGLPQAQEGVLGEMANATASTINAPQGLASDTDISIVAKNQLAVVRVGTISCFDMDLLLPGGKVAFSAAEACGGMSGSGSIVSSTGYVSTNGHVVRMSPSEALMIYVELAAQNKDYDPLQKYMQYLQDANILSAAAIKAIKEGVSGGSEEALQKLVASFALIPQENFKVKSQVDDFAIQLSDEPIKLKFTGTKVSFVPANTIAKATFVDANFKVNSKKAGVDGSSSDVALLKMTDQKTYPVVELGSIGNVKANDQITVVGFPGFVDGGLTTTQDKTIPTATQGSVIDLGPIGDYEIIQTSVPLAEGNSGGPAFDSKGLQIGLATYVQLSATDPDLGVTKFAKASFLRDVADLKALATKNSVTLSSASSTSDNWHKGVDAFQDAKYAQALDYFNKTRSGYTDTYLIAALSASAQSFVPHANIGGVQVSPSLVLVVGIVALLLLILVIVLLIRHHLRGKVLHTQYGDIPGGHGGFTPPPPIFPASPPPLG